MDFRKERNFIVAYEFDTMQGKWDITTGQFIGKSGKPVKSIPRAFVYSNLPSYRRAGQELGYIIRMYREWLSDSWHNYHYTEQRGARLEQLISLNLYPSGFSDLDDTATLDKPLVSYLIENCNGCYSANRVRRYLNEKKYAALLEDKPEWYQDVFNHLMVNGNESLPYDYVKNMLNRCMNEKVNYFFKSQSDTVSRLIVILQDYYRICNALYDSVKINPNVLSNMGHLYALEKEWKDRNYNEVLNTNNNCPWLYYEDETYIIRPILTREGFHAEGESQHNCVERLYMEKVYEGKTHVVTVRKKANPNKSYITCEVSNDGTIWQYLLACNSRPRNDADIALKQAYAEHIKREMAN